MINKKNIQKIWPLFLCIGMLAGCSTNTTASSTAAINTESTDIDWKNAEHTIIKLEDGTTEISKSGIYELTGSQQDGSVIINVDKTKDEETVYLVLNNATIESKTSAPIYIKEAKKVEIFLEDGTVNTVTQGAEAVTDESGDPSSAIFSKADLTIAGTGNLQVASEYNDGITSKDDLVISGGVIQVNAVGDGITGKDMIAVETADITINAGKDGMRSTNTTDTTKGSITISDGTFHITAANDAIQAEQIIQIDGGTFDLDSNGNIVMNGGSIVIDTSATGQGDTPIDYDGTCTVNGGTITDQNGTAIDYQNQQRGGRGERPAMPDSENASGERPAMPDGENANGERPAMPDGESMSGERPQRGKGGRKDESGS